MPGANDERIQALQRIPLLANLPHGDLAAIGERMLERKLPPGAELIREGTSGSSIFLISRGTCEVRRKTPSGTVRLATLSPGDFFGELSVIDPAPRTATVTAMEDCVVLELSGYDFRAALQANRAMADHLIKVLATRLRQLEDEFAPRIRA
jgi:CRP/FNR family transcriptional regulator